MIFTKTFKFRLRPNRKQESLCCQSAGGARWIFNRGLNQRNTLWEEEKRSISLFDQNNELVLLKNQEETSWLTIIHSQVLQQALHDLNEAIDVGLEHFATIATEEGIEEINSPRFLKKKLARIKYLSRRLSKKKLRSQNRLKAKQALNAEHARIKNQRKDWQHKLSTHLVKSHDKIVIESLAVKELLEKETKSRARAISDAGWRGFLQMLKYKCEERGKELLEVGRYFPSTKQCYKCKNRNEISLEQREYSCSCGHRVHRDHNAALNLRAAGMSV
jgi:IS605 OrfB family transposase